MQSTATREPGRPVRGGGTPGQVGAAAALAATLGLAAASWVVAVRQMNGMDMGVATRLGSFAFFVAVWVPMMAAMMLPGAAPAVVRRAHASGRVRAVPLFVGSYVCRLDTRRRRGVCAVPAARSTGRRRGCDRGRCLRVHAAQAGTSAGGAASSVRSGFEFGLCCVGSSIGLMLMLVALERHERHLDVGDRRHRPRPEAPARRELPSTCPLALAIDGTRNPDRHRALRRSPGSRRRCKASSGAAGHAGCHAKEHALLSTT